MPQHGPNMTPRRPEVAHWWPKMAPMAHDGPWVVTDGPRMAPRWVRMAPDGSNIVQIDLNPPGTAHMIHERLQTLCFRGLLQHRLSWRSSLVSGPPQAS